MKFIFIKSFLICSFIFTSFIAFAQWQGKVYEPFQNAKVFHYGNELRSPWCGGINSFYINHADINNDGKKDLVLYDYSNNTVKTFLNIGNNGEIKYQYNPLYEKNFPEIYYYMILKDYNCDGIPDMYDRGYYGVRVHTGYYQNNELHFNFYKDLFFQGQNGPVNVYVQPSDIPSIVDIDGDGDLDILSYDVLGAMMSLYKNRQVEDNLPCDSIKMTLFENCWGKFYQGINRAVSLNMNCKGVAGEYKKQRHTGNTSLHLDIDGDGDLDVLGGNISFADIQLLINNGSNIITSQDTNYNKNAHKLQMPFWPSASHIDIDNNGSRDILISSHYDGLNNANYNTLAFYKNLGTDASPNFVFQHDTLLTPDMIDVGIYSYPTFFDYNKDGKPDLFIGTEGYLNNNTIQLQSKLAYYRNISTPGNVAFELVTKDFLNLSSKNYSGIFPTFGDLTGDDIDDLVLGNANGTIAIYKNFAANNAIQPNFLYFTDSMANVYVDDYSMPLVFDFNQDGKSDLLIGTQAGNLVYYQDTSTAINLKKMALINSNLGNVIAGAPTNFYGYCAPFAGKIDNTQKTFLMVGNVDGTIQRYDENFVNNNNVFSLIDSNYSYIQSTNRSVPAVADLDGDGKYEMVVGHKYGGLLYYKQVIDVAVGTKEYVLQNDDFILYPNPASDEVIIASKIPLYDPHFVVNIYDLSGKKVASQLIDAEKENRINIKNLKNGMYYFHISDKDNKQIIRKKITVLQ